jgi:hypothetical protein
MVIGIGGFYNNFGSEKFLLCESLGFFTEIESKEKDRDPKIILKPIIKKLFP